MMSLLSRHVEFFTPLSSLMASRTRMFSVCASDLAALKDRDPVKYRERLDRHSAQLGARYASDPEYRLMKLARDKERWAQIKESRESKATYNKRLAQYHHSNPGYREKQRARRLDPKSKQQQ